jgi:hypothetical protein
MIANKTMFAGTATMLALSLSLAAAVDLKPQCRGLVIREYCGQELLPGMDSVVAHVLWKDLETADQKFDGPSWELMEKARKIPGIEIRLRILCGIHAPGFVKKLGGPGLSDLAHQIDCSQTGGIGLWNAHDTRGGTTPQYWLTEVLDQCEQLMAEVARRYENQPEVCEAVDSACMAMKVPTSGCSRRV